MVLRQEQVPQSQLPGPLLEHVHDGRMLVESLDGALAQLLSKDCVGGDTFFFDKLFDLRSE